MIAEVSALQTPFCLQCEFMLLNDQICASCGWKRPNQFENDGDVVWSMSLDGSFAKPYHLPALYKDILLTCIESRIARDGILASIVAINLINGSVIWSQDMPIGCVSRFLKVSNDTLLVGLENLTTLAEPKNSLIAIDPSTGIQKWSFEVPAHSLSAPAIIGDILFFSASNRAGFGLNLSTGQQCWHIKNLVSSWCSLHATAGDSCFYLGGRTSKIKRIDLDGNISTFFHSNDEKDWFDIPLTYADGVLYAISRNKQLYAIDTVRHQLKWEASVARGATAPPVIGRYVFVPIKDFPSRTYSLRAFSIETGDRIWQFDINRHFQAPASTIDEIVFIGGNDRNFYALDSLSGKKLWSIDLENKVRTAPIISGNHVCVGTEHGKLYLIRWRQEGEHKLLTANHYRDLKQWSLAGTAAIIEGDWLSAANDYERVGAFYKAAQLFEKAGVLARAAKLFLHTSNYSQAAKLYNLLNDKQGEAAALVGLNQFERAAELYGELNMHNRAAEIYRDAGHLNRAADQFNLAGNFYHAAEIYKELDKHESAAEMYQKADMNDLAVQSWLQADEPYEAARVLEKTKKFGRASKLLESEGDIDNAAAVWLRQGNVEQAAIIYKRAKRWVQAAELYESNYEREKAARLYEQGGRLQKAAKLYLANLQFGKAAELFIQMQDAISAAKAYEKERNWRRAAQLYLSISPPLYQNAGQCYENLEAWQEAANTYEDGKFYEDAIRNWLSCGNSKRAAKLLSRKGNTFQAAQLLENEGEQLEAAHLYLKNGSVSDAIRLYRLSGNEEHALEVLVQQEAWDEYRALAIELKRYEREAEACVALAEQSSRTEAYKLDIAAAQAYERAAQKYEEENIHNRTDEEIAQLWLLAAKYYELGDSSDERIANCERQAKRLRKLPEIVIDVKAQKELVLNEYHRLLVRVKNVGYGEAFDITFKVINDQFESDLQFTQDFSGVLLPDKMKKSLFSVKPKTSGSAVPMKILLTYRLPDETLAKRTIALEVQVHPSSSKLTATGQLGHQPLIDMYEDTGFHQSAISLLVKKIEKHFNLQELHQLSFSLNIDWENLEGTTKYKKAFELVRYCQVRYRMPELIGSLSENRPVNVNWREGFDDH
ncbi:MAG: hypothetical protein DWQ04_29595 [Chloroflexi bacterium]|nr:MAG: hypothetical protein DWQ04_29595 [Chloroflexota bacterium]